MKNMASNIILFTYSCQAEYDNYIPIIRHLKSTNYNSVLLDLTGFSAYKINKSSIEVEDIRLLSDTKYYLKLFIPNKVLKIINFKRKVEKLINTYKVSMIIMGTDNEPLHLTMIQIAKKIKILSIVYQAGILLPNTNEYERKVYLKRYGKYGYSVYILIRRLLKFINIIPFRNHFGKNGADYYLVYSQYYKDMLGVNESVENNIRIVGPAKYDNKLIRNNHKENIILYANYLFKKTLTDSRFDDKLIIEIIHKSIPSEYSLVIKPHPSETYEDYRSLSIPENIKILEPESDIEEYLKKSAMLISETSTVIFDAIFYKTKVLLIDNGNKHSLQQNRVLIEYTHKIEDINNELINKYLFDEAFTSKILSGQKECFNKLMGEYSGENATIFCDTIIDILKNQSH